VHISFSFNRAPALLPEAHSNRRPQYELDIFGVPRDEPFSSPIERRSLRRFFWLFVFSRGGGLARHLLHALCYCEMFDLSRNHRVEPLA
jgi:hypothetical protein